MFQPNSFLFSLENFEGSLDLLLYLVQKEEIDVRDVSLTRLTKQLLARLQQEIQMEESSQALALASSLMILKSQKLLPTPHDEESGIDAEMRLELIENLLEYCRFKEAAKALIVKEEEAKKRFSRAASFVQKELGFGLEEVNVEKLKTLFHEVLAKAPKQSTGVIQDEEWHVADKIVWLKNQRGKLAFTHLFSPTMPRQELIVLFLALLELMKGQEVKVVREEEEVYILSTFLPEKA